ncbi:MAG: DUF302 domain-containing protein [Geminicoccaceae bacterium]
MLRIPSLFAALAMLVSHPLAAADMPSKLDGWSIRASPHGWKDLGERLATAIGESPLAMLSKASATVGASRIGKTIDGNMVVHAFAPQFAVRMLEASVAAGYEAPLRFYITENADGTASLSYKLPTTVFAPYEDGGDALDALAVELDAIMDTIASAAVSP